MSDADRSSDTVFGAIVRGEIAADIIYEDDRCIAFRDLNPQAPTHVLVIPRIGILGLQQADQADPELLGHLLQIAQTVARQEGLEADGWRVVVNVGEAGGQTVEHLHLHVLGGRQMTWPPG